MLEIEGLSFAYGTATSKALRNVTLTARAGEFVAVAGANKSGKSSLCYAVTGVVPSLFGGQIQGHVRVAGVEAANAGVAGLSRVVSLVMQKPEQQLSGMRFTVQEEIAFRLENQGVPVRDIHTRVENAMCRTGLAPFAQCSPHCLSGGQLQRVAIASALAADTPVLVLDEPTTFLDPSSAVNVFVLLKELAAEGKTILLTEQRLDSIAAFADRVVVLHEGAVALDGPPSGVLASPELFAAGLDWTRYTKAVHAAQTLCESAVAEFSRPSLRVSPRESSSESTGESSGVSTCYEPLPVTLEAAVEVFTAMRNEPYRRIKTVPMSADGLEHCASGNGGCDSGKSTVGVTAGKCEEVEHVIEIDGLCFHYHAGVPVLHDISLTVSSGERVALLGHNGSGKSTLVKHLNGLLKPAEGVVQIAGLGTGNARVPELAAKVGLLFQNPDDQICKNTVRDEVAFGPRHLGYAPERVAVLVEQALEAMQLQAQAACNPHDLGYSERKRLAIASVLAMDTRIVVFDEPTAGLDPYETSMLTTALNRLEAEGKTVLIISHDMDFVAETTTRGICLHEGRKCFDGRIADMFASPNLLKDCGLLPPQVIQLACAFSMHLENLTPEGVAKRLMM